MKNIDSLNLSVFITGMAFLYFCGSPEKKQKSIKILSPEKKQNSAFILGPVGTLPTHGISFNEIESQI